MLNTITEKNWKAFKVIKTQALEQFCQSVLDEVMQLCRQDESSAHDRYLELWQLLKDRDKKIEMAFDGHSRSQALRQLSVMVDLGLVSKNAASDIDEYYQ